MRGVSENGQLAMWSLHSVYITLNLYSSSELPVRDSIGGRFTICTLPVLSSTRLRNRAMGMNERSQASPFV